MTNSNTPLVPVVLSGGSGTRLWPASRLTQPKQLLPLVEARSLLRATIDRVSVLGDTRDPIIVANKDHADAITQEMVASGYANATLILEPIGRNTAPAIAVAAMEVLKSGDAVMLILPADHTIADEDEFRIAIANATRAAESGYLVTFGITPSHAETGYGYIKAGTPITDTVKQIVEFKEKPDAATATSYFESGDYLWNSGMFLIKASTYLAELEAHAPDIAASAASSFANASMAEGRVLLDAAEFSACRSESIDYAVMEQTSMAAVVPTDPGWNDVGTWSSLFDIADKDGDNNVLLGDVIGVNVTGTYARSTSRLVAAVGVDNLVIVETADAVLVARKDASQDVKTVVDSLKESARQELVSDGTTLRPWGRFRTVESGPGFRVLRISLDAGAKTSLQTHRHRSEHWVVVRGVARVTVGESERIIPQDESIMISPGEVHRLENAGDDILEVIAIDIGPHLGDESGTGKLDGAGRTENEA